MKRILYLLLTLPFSLVQAQQPDNSLDAAFSQTKAYTDEEIKESQTFNHQGIRKEKIDQGCKVNPKACDGTQVDQAGSVFKDDTLTKLENQLPKLYSTLAIGPAIAAGKLPTVNLKEKGDKKGSNSEKNTKGETASQNKENTKEPKTDKKTTDAKDKKEKNERFDYCAAAVIGHEVLNKFVTESKLKGIQQKLEEDKKTDEQKKALIALKATHELRSKTSRNQSIAFGAGAACYVAQAFTGAKMDAMFWAKMVAAGAISTIYGIKSGKHKKAAEVVDKVINSLPKDGHCNPYTETKCFCEAPSTKTEYPEKYQELCVLKKGVADLIGNDIPCGVLVAGKMTIDATCKCKRNNTCYKPRVKLAGGLNTFQSNLMNDLNSAYGSLNNGELDGARMNAMPAKLAAYSERMTSQADLSGKLADLSPQERKISDDLKKAGLPSLVADMVAQQPPMNPPGFSPAAMPSLSSLSPELKKEVEALEDVKYSSGGSSSQDSAEEPAVSFQVPGAEEQESSTEVLTFAEAAVDKADVSNSPETPIFDIISNRYKRSGWTKLESSEVK